MANRKSKIMVVGVGLAAAVLALPASALVTAPAEASISPKASFSSSVFDIKVEFEGGLTTSQKAVFSAAEFFWETMITGYQIAFTADGTNLYTGPTIKAKGAAGDGIGGVLASAGPNTAYNVSDGTLSYAYVNTGTMTFDTNDLPGMEASGTFLDVIVHEMGHVLGFGTLWNTNSLAGFSGTQSVYTNGSGQYTGAYGLAAYNAEFGLSATSVPVELDYGPGTANGHWDEANFVGGSRDIMTGIINSVSGTKADAPFAASTLSATTIASFADLGYTTTITHGIAPVPLPAGMLLSLTALAGLAGVSRRKTRAA
ncbi:hypothetical protein ACN2XU_18010 [Primorskyibacter sp. 2E107]|uniref:hypothetical protein n=1 Tax=Primorskyibacter sp. 2E107 TaxID=3403458 RepID=UPI003AF9901A